MSQKSNTGHLTSNDISRWLIEGRFAEADAHLQSCWACQAKLAEAGEPLTAFRSAVIAWSEDRAAQPAPVRTEDFQHIFNLRSWLPALGFVPVLALLITFLINPTALRRHSVPPAVAGLSDSVLMEQVDTEVSETVPDAMAPLTDLVAWESEEGAAESEKQTTRAKPTSVGNFKTDVTD